MGVPEKQAAYFSTKGKKEDAVAFCFCFRRKPKTEDAYWRMS